MATVFLSRPGAGGSLLSQARKQTPSASFLGIPSNTLLAFYLDCSSSRQLCVQGSNAHGAWSSIKRSRIKRIVLRSTNRGINSSHSDEIEDNEGSGNKEVQDMLVSMVRLQAGELQVNEFIDERARLLTNIAEDAKVEYGRIAEDAKRGIDEAGSKVLESVEADVQALEEELASVRAEIEADEQEFYEFENNIQKARNAGLFFKGLYQRPKPLKNRSTQELCDLKAEANPLVNLTRKSAGSNTRTAVYGFLIFLLTLTLVEVVTAENVSWPRVGIYLAILLFMVFQLVYEKSSVSNEDQKG